MSFTVEISKPIKNFEGNEVTSLKFREPEFYDIIKVEEIGGGLSKQLRSLMVSCSTYEESELNKLAIKDVKKIQEKFMPFLDSPDEQQETETK